MKKVKIETFKVIGIATRTTNENGQAAKDIPALWGRFTSEGLAAQIPNKIDSSVLCIYTNYESDHTKPYDTILGCRVSSIEKVPEGMIAQEFSAGDAAPFTAKGNLLEGAVYTAWLDIWKSDLDRNYVADFEVYDERAQNPTDAEVSIFVGVK